MRKPILIIITAITIAITLTGCVNRSLVESYEQYLDTAGTEYIQYVIDDPKLDDNDRTVRITNDRLARDTVAKFKTTKWSW